MTRRAVAAKATRALRDRPLFFLLAVAGALAAAMPLAAAEDPRHVITLMFYAAPLLALAASRGIIAADIREGRWPLIFQKPLHPVRHYALEVATSFAACFLLLAIAAAAALLAAGAVATRIVLGSLIAACASAAVVICLAAAVGALTRRYELELVVLILALSTLQTLLADVLRASPTVRVIAERLLFPINPLANAFEHHALAAPMAAGAWAHLTLYPLACIAVAAWRLHGYHTARTSPL